MTRKMIDQARPAALPEEDLVEARGGIMKTKHDSAKNAQLQPSPLGLTPEETARKD